MQFDVETGSGTGTILAAPSLTPEQAETGIPGLSVGRILSADETAAVMESYRAELEGERERERMNRIIATGYQQAAWFLADHRKDNVRFKDDEYAWEKLYHAAIHLSDVIAALEVM